MFTTQAARQIDSLTAPPGADMWFKKWLEQFRPVMRNLVGNCAQPLEHRGPVEIRNTHADVEIPPEGEPALTICTSRANDQLPDPPPVALYVECGESVFQDVHIEGETIIDGPVVINDCVTLNAGIIMNGVVVNRRSGYSSSVVRFCLTSDFDASTRCASAQIIGFTGNGTCYPDYNSTGFTDCPAGPPAITVVDRSGKWSKCGVSGDCGYAAYFSNSSVTSECDDACDDPGGGVYEVMHLDPNDSEFTQCYVDVVVRICCIAGFLVSCVRRVYFPYPVKFGAVDCGGSGDLAGCT